jgi:SAM-dependent methyltransferase
MTAADGPANGNVPDADLADDADDAVNRRYWDGYSGEYQQTHGPQLRQPMVWGLYGTPERRVRALGEVRDRDILELGCGAAQWSIFLAQQGARPVGLDNSEQQLAHARRLMDELGVDFPLVHSPAEKTPLPSASFDLVFCDHGAMSYVDPALSLPEVGRLLRPGGRLVFNLTTPFTYVCWNDDLERADESLHYDYFGMRRWVDIEGFVSYEVGYGEWIRLFRRHGFVVEDLIELRPARSARSSYRTRADLDWSRRWPGEHIWCVYREG